MKKALTLAAAAVALLASTQEKDIFVANGFTWSQPDIGAYSIEGACKIAEEEVSCWDVHGTPESALTSRITDRLRSTHTQITMMMGKKNRLVVGSWKGAPVSPPASATMEAEQTPSSAYGSSLLFVHGAKQDRSVNVKLTVHYTAKPVFEIAGREGAASQYQGQSVTVQKVVRSQGGLLASMAMSSESQPTWRVYLSTEGNLTGLFVRPTSVDQKPFSFVNTSGSPIPGMTAPIKDKPSVAIANFGFSMNKKQWWIDTNIDPKKLTGFAFHLPASKQVTFRNIPLDPK